MNRVKLKISVATVTVACGFLLPSASNIPTHAAQPVSAWFQDLCSGVFGGPPKTNGFKLGHAAFAESTSHGASRCALLFERRLSADRFEFAALLVSFVG